MVSRRTILLGGGTLVLAGAAISYASLRGLGTIEEYNASVAEMRTVLKDVPEMHNLIRYATLAANSHNTQPWRFKLDQRGIDIVPDFTRRLLAVDPDNHHLFVSLGCAVENLAIAGAMRGKAGAVSFNPLNGGIVSFAFDPTSINEPDLFDAIPRRQSTRSQFDGRTVDSRDLKILVKSVAIPGVDLVLITERAQIDRISDLVIAGNSIQMADPAFMQELKTWLRFNPRQAIETSDGLFSATTGNPILPSWLGPHLLDFVFNAGAENKKYTHQIASSAGIAVFTAEKEDPEHWVLVGRACQRFALQATALGMKYAFINQPVEVSNLRPELAARIGIPGRRPDIVIRFGYGAALPFSARRSVNAVIDQKPL